MELADLLLDWPADYAQAMRAPFEALFEKTAREADERRVPGSHSALKGTTNFPSRSSTNSISMRPAACAPASCRGTRRWTARRGNARSVDGPALVEAARTMNGAFAARFASTLSLPGAIAREILTDASGQSLAVACKGAGLDRAAFSAIALLTAPELGCERLCHFDAVPQTGAERLLDFWRGRQGG